MSASSRPHAWIEALAELLENSDAILVTVPGELHPSNLALLSTLGVTVELLPTVSSDPVRTLGGREA